MNITDSYTFYVIVDNSGYFYCLDNKKYDKVLSLLEADFFLREKEANEALKIIEEIYDIVDMSRRSVRKVNAKLSYDTE